MKLLGGMRAKLSGQTQEAFGEGQQFPLTKPLVQSIHEHISELRRADLSHYTFERRHSSYPDAKSDIVIYNAEREPVLHGRENRDGRMSFWH